MAEEISKEELAMAGLMDQLAGKNRRQRQEASKILAALAKESPEELLPYTSDLVKALNHPEAQTRWQILETLTELMPHDYKKVAVAFSGAEESLFDETSSAVRLAAFRYICALGKVNTRYADKVWPLIDEAIQCYHGDPEFRDMLSALSDFAKAKMTGTTREKFIERMSFDAENSRGYIKQFSQEIVQTLSQK